jgi:hypothetical protein
VARKYEKVGSEEKEVGPSTSSGTEVGRRKLEEGRRHFDKLSDLEGIEWQVRLKT